MKANQEKKALTFGDLIKGGYRGCGRTSGEEELSGLPPRLVLLCFKDMAFLWFLRGNVKMGETPYGDPPASAQGLPPYDDRAMNDNRTSHAGKPAGARVRSQAALSNERSERHLQGGCRTRSLAYLALLLMAGTWNSCAAADPLASRVTVYRDTYGVPHIVGDTLEATFFGYGFAQAEDHLEPMMIQYRDAQGRRAEVLGRDALSEKLPSLYSLRVSLEWRLFAAIVAHQGNRLGAQT